MPQEGGEEYPPAEQYDAPAEQYGEEGGALPADDSNMYGAAAEYDPAGGEEVPAEGYGGGGEYEPPAEYDPQAEVPAEASYGAGDAYGDNPYGAADVDPYATDPYGGAAAAAVAAPVGHADSSLMAAEREKYEQQLKVEAQSREVSTFRSL